MPPESPQFYDNKMARVSYLFENILFNRSFVTSINFKNYCIIFQSIDSLKLQVPLLGGVGSCSPAWWLRQHGQPRFSLAGSTVLAPNFPPEPLIYFGKFYYVLGSFTAQKVHYLNTRQNFYFSKSKLLLLLFFQIKKICSFGRCATSSQTLKKL